MLRSITPEDFIADNDTATMVLDIRREDDYNGSNEIISGAVWKDPAKIDGWIDSVPKQGQVVIYCARGGGVSNSIVDRLQSEGINAQFIEGGIEGLKNAGGIVERK